jgi:hypothetical protein
LSHFTICPSSMVGERASMWTLVAIRFRLVVQCVALRWGGQIELR